MLLDPRDWSLAPAIDDVLGALPDELRDHVSSETHSSCAAANAHLCLLTKRSRLGEPSSRPLVSWAFAG